MIEWLVFAMGMHLGLRVLNALVKPRVSDPADPADPELRKILRQIDYECGIVDPDLVTPIDPRFQQWQALLPDAYAGYTVTGIDAEAQQVIIENDTRTQRVAMRLMKPPPLTIAQQTGIDQSRMRHPSDPMRPRAGAGWLPAPLDPTVREAVRRQIQKDLDAAQPTLQRELNEIMEQAKRQGYDH